MEIPKCPKCGETNIRAWWKVDVTVVVKNGEVVGVPETCSDEPYPVDEISCFQCGYIADRENYNDLMDSLDILLAQQP